MTSSEAVRAIDEIMAREEWSAWHYSDPIEALPMNVLVDMPEEQAIEVNDLWWATHSSN